MGVRFRELAAGEIECRIGTISKSGNGLSLLLFKDARVDQNILDETVGAENWQCDYYEQKGTLFCKVGVLCETANGQTEWVYKADAGAPSNMEAAKGEASDAFKRACFKWGIGRELYTAPFIWVPAEKCTIKQGKNGKWTCYDRFRVAKVAIEGGRIKGLRIVKENNNAVVFSWKEG